MEPIRIPIVIDLSVVVNGAEKEVPPPLAFLPETIEAARMAAQKPLRNVYDNGRTIPKPKAGAGHRPGKYDAITEEEAAKVYRAKAAGLSIKEILSRTHTSMNRYHHLMYGPRSKFFKQRFAKSEASKVSSKDATPKAVSEGGPEIKEIGPKDFIFGNP